MSVFKCKMCGGTLEINSGETVAVCEYCGTKQTLPNLDDEKRANLYDRANHFRRNNEFDKASAIYEQLLNEDGNDAECYWSLVLCRYGIEYVEDPSSQKRVPTVNRAQFTSIFDDDNYKEALRHADSYQKSIYEDEANAINEIQKGILAISQKEEPFDVFICYKETDNNGRRTPDSVLATELYHELTKEGYKVFFSRITLEDKLGVAYEPYIFAALNSAKVMVALGTKAEHFNAVWVKNEWSRFLALIKNGSKKILIPAYRDMDPYDLPEEFSHLQAQDMSKLGFMQDLVRGIKKIIGTEEATTTDRISGPSENGINIAPIIDRAFLLIEDGDTQKADECLEEALMHDPRNPMIYVAKLLIEANVKTQDALATSANTFENSANYQKAVRFSSGELKATLEGYNASIVARNAEKTYDEAVRIMNMSAQEESFLRAKELFDSISNYKDASEKAKECAKKAGVAKEEQIYKEASDLLNNSAYSLKKEVENAKKAIASFETIKDYKDSGEQILAANHKIAELEQEILVHKKKNKVIAMIAAPIILAIIIFLIVLFTVIIPKNNYDKANTLFAANKFEEAYNLYVEAGNYSDAKDKATECQYQRAVALRNEKKWDEANSLFEEIKGYKDSDELIHYHEYEEIENKEVSCTEDGFKKYHCSGCEDVYTDVITALGHNYSEATCTEAEKCLNCGETKGKALGHSYESNRCSRCGAEKAFGAGEKWIVDGQWELTVHSAKRHYMCNQFADENGMAACVIFTYSYKNLGYTDDLFISSFDVYDGNGEAAESYPCTHTTNPKTCSVGMKCSNAQDAYALYNNTSTITLNFEKYASDGRGKQKATFVIPIS